MTLTQRGVPGSPPRASTAGGGRRRAGGRAASGGSGDDAGLAWVLWRARAGGGEGVRGSGPGGGRGSGDGRGDRRAAQGRARRERAPPVRRGGHGRSKVGARDLAACVVQGALGSTTVGGTLAVCRRWGSRSWAPAGSAGCTGDSRTRSTSRPTCCRSRAPRRWWSARAPSRSWMCRPPPSCAGDARGAGAWLADADVAAVLHRRRRAAGVRDGYLGRGSGSDRQRALGD